jgi:hypothetical protein
MKIEGQGKLLRIYVGESDKCGSRPLFEAIVARARELGLAGTTVLRGIEGFGASARMHTAKILRLSEDLPILIEIADTEERLQEALPEIEKLIDESACGVLMTVEKVEIFKYRPKK